MRCFHIRLLLLLYLACAPWRAYGQQPEALLSTQAAGLIHAPDDTEGVQRWYQLGMQYEGVNMDSARYCYDQALAASKRLRYVTGVMRYAPNFTAVLNQQGRYREALDINLTYLQLARSLRRPDREAIQIANIANSYNWLQRWDSAATWYFEAIRLFEEAKDTNALASTYSNLSGVYSSCGNPHRALQYAATAADYARPYDDRIYMSALDNLASLQMDLKQFGASLRTYREAEVLAKETRSIDVLANIYAAYNDYDLHTNNWPKMLTDARLYYTTVQKLHSPRMTATALFGLARASFYNQHWAAADTFIRQCLAALDTQDIGLRKKVLNLAANISLAEGSVADYEQFSNCADSLEQATLDSATLKRITELEARYESQKKEGRIALQASQLRQAGAERQVLWIAIAGLLISALMAARAYRNKQLAARRAEDLQQQAITQLQQEKQLAATEAVLRGQDEERRRLAKDLHDGLGGMLSGIKFSLTTLKDNLAFAPDTGQAFERSLDMLDSAIRELRRVAHNMMPESLAKFGLDAALEDLCRYAGSTGVVRVRYQSLGLTGRHLDQNTALNVYRMVQELLNNIMKHAAAGEALVQVLLRDGVCSLTVEDDGRGFDAATAGSSTGIGMASLRNRVDYLQGRMDVDSRPGTGTSVHVEFPVGQGV